MISYKGSAALQTATLTPKAAITVVLSAAAIRCRYGYATSGPMHR